MDTRDAWIGRVGAEVSTCAASNRGGGCYYYCIVTEVTKRSCFFLQGVGFSQHTVYLITEVTKMYARMGREFFFVLYRSLVGWRLEVSIRCAWCLLWARCTCMRSCAESGGGDTLFVCCFRLLLLLSQPCLSELFVNTGVARIRLTLLARCSSSATSRRTPALLLAKESSLPF